MLFCLWKYLDLVQSLYGPALKQSELLNLDQWLFQFTAKPFTQVFLTCGCFQGGNEG